jgi:prepilin-type processing-associated H-X9-DG protein
MNSPPPVLPDEAAKGERRTPSPVPALAYAAQSPGNPPAVASLVWGLMLIVPFAAGILALKFGRRGIRHAQTIGGIGRRMSEAGMTLGLINLCLWVVAAAATGPAIIRARQQARTVTCASQLRQFSAAVLMYSSANSGALPPDLDALAAFLGPRTPATLFACPEVPISGAPPASTLKSGLATSYVYIPPPPGVKTMAQVTNPAGTVVVFEPLANHADRGFNAAYWDGHVEFHGGPGAAALAATLTAQAAANAAARQNPAPATAPSAPAEPEQGGSP